MKKIPLLIIKENTEIDILSKNFEKEIETIHNEGLFRINQMILEEENQQDLSEHFSNILKISREQSIKCSKISELFFSKVVEILVKEEILDDLNSHISFYHNVIFLILEEDVPDFSKIMGDLYDNNVNR